MTVSAHLHDTIVHNGARNVVVMAQFLLSIRSLMHQYVRQTLKLNRNRKPPVYDNPYGQLYRVNGP